VDEKRRGDLVRKIITQVREREYPYERRHAKEIRWTSYDVAQCNEIADVIELIRVLVDRAEERLSARNPPSPRGPGRPPVSPADVTKVLLAQSYFGAPNRVAEGILRLLWRNLGLQEPFSYKTIERGYDKAAVNALLDEILTLTNLPVRGLEKIFSIDGSGSPTRSRQNYADDRGRQRRKSGGARASRAAFPKGKMDYVYSVATVGVSYKLVSSWHNTTDHSIGELSFFDVSMRDTHSRHPDMAMVSGDGMFATRPCCKLVGELGAVPRFLPRRNVTFKRRGVVEWVDMLCDLVDDPQQWLSDYYQREASESVNSAIKRKNPWPLRKRLDGRRCTEDKLRGLCYNVRQLCYLRYLADLSVLPVIMSSAS